ncbi:MAG: diguanylate cyclase [Kiritimatiellae bacterium]|nr:diguanylate cyclase [Kiritimatiellia bacterium]
MANELKAIIEWMINVFRELGGALTIEEALHIVIENIKNHFPHQTLAVLTADENTSNLVIRNSRNLSYSYVKNFSRAAHGNVTDRLLLKHDRVLLNNINRAGPDYAEIKLEHDFNHACLVPIVQNQRAIGYLHCDRIDDPPFTEDDARELLAIGYLIGQQIARHELLTLTRNLARTDEASKALKYHAFLEQYLREAARAKTYNNPLTLMLFGIDNYTQYVATCGVAAGHALLEEVHRLIRSNAREIDFIGRFAADKFIVCLGGMNSAEAKKTAENIHAAIQKQTALTARQPTLVNGVSMTFARKEDLNFPVEKIFARLGSGLLAARRQGAGQIIVINPEQKTE